MTYSGRTKAEVDQETREILEQEEQQQQTEVIDKLSITGEKFKFQNTTKK